MPLTLQQVIQEVCAFVGVEVPTTSVFAALNSNRTMQEMVALANEMARRIAYDTRDWTELRQLAVFTGDGSATAFNLPANYKRMLLTANVRSTTNPTQPLAFVPDYDQWLEHRLRDWSSGPNGEYTISGGQMLIDPVLAAAAQVQFPYLESGIIRLHGAAGVYSDTFLNDDDTYRLDARLLKLGMIWQWKAHKGSPYAEDMGSFSDALAMAMGHDQPAPIIIGRVPSSRAQVAYPGVLTGPPWPFP